MSTNFRISLCLSRLQGAFVTNIKGRFAVKRCLCIPIEDAELFEAESGNVYINLNAYELRYEKHGNTHLIKQSLSRKRFDEMSDGERRNLPIVGNLAPLFERRDTQRATAPPTSEAEESVNCKKYATWKKFPDIRQFRHYGWRSSGFAAIAGASHHRHTTGRSSFSSY